MATKNTKKDCCPKPYIIREIQGITGGGAQPPSEESFELLDSGDKELLDNGDFELLD